MESKFRESKEAIAGDGRPRAASGFNLACWLRAEMLRENVQLPLLSRQGQVGHLREETSDAVE